MELDILDAIQKIRTPFGDFIMPLITRLGDMGLFWIALAVLLIIFPKTRRTGMVVGVALVLDVILCNAILKPLVARVRPYDVNLTVQLLISRPIDYSFPSGHSAASFAAASAMLFAGSKRLGWAAVVLAAIIAFSRLYLYVHYPTDVLGGILLGIVCGFVAGRIVPILVKKFDKRKST